ncbi:hypothetical protein ACQP00_36375 [Dactylosporangium sp. CS-047395]|uniref:hypothetical protein n=1 Tax=Dactylosporangium sp. CS-047395 TaxID=3239936 RepID=UPI003D8F5777
MTTKQVRAALMAVVVLLIGASACSQHPAASAGPERTPTFVQAPISASPASDRDGDGLSDSIDVYPDDPTNTPPPEATITCAMDKDFRTRSIFVVKSSVDSAPDFGHLWVAKPYSCEAVRNTAPFSQLEETAYKTSGYTEHDIKTLYAICGAVSPDDVYASAGYAASESQISEINAALVLCPGHPYANAWRQAVQRGKVKADQRAAGKRFGAGTFLVGKEIAPGTYFVEGEISGCYWERQDKAGSIIENGFIRSARRVQVSIRSSDYAFHSEKCGEWART